MAVGRPLRAALRSNCPSGELPPAVSLAPAILDTARTKRRTKRNTTDLSLRKARILKKSPSRRNKSEDIARGVATESKQSLAPKGLGVPPASRVQVPDFTGLISKNPFGGILRVPNDPPQTGRRALVGASC